MAREENSDSASQASRPMERKADGSGYPLETEAENDASDTGCMERASNALSTLVPAGSMAATIFSTAATCLGGGILGLPSAFSCVGAVAGNIWLFVIALVSVYSLRCLAITAERVKKNSYEQLASCLLGRGCTYLVGALRLVQCLGAMIAYVTSIGNLLEPILDGANAPDSLMTDPGFRLMQALLWVLFFFPLTLFRDVNNLRYVSTVAIMGMLFFTVCVFAHFCEKGKGEDIDMFRSGNIAISGVGVFVFTYGCQVNSIEIYYEMKKPSATRFTICATISMIVCASLYVIAGLFGYLEFGNSVGSSILLRYDPIHEPQMLISYIMVFIKLATSYGLFGNACRSAILVSLGMDPKTVSMWKHLLCTVVVGVATLLSGLFIPDVNTVFGFVGGVCGGMLGFILPALFILYAGDFTLKSVGVFTYFAVFLMLIGGVAAVVFSTGATIYDTFPHD